MLTVDDEPGGYRMTDRLALGVTEAAKLLGISRSKLYEAVRDKRLRVVRFGRRVLIPLDALKAFLDRGR
jgi:excisionase family DNA binding protein